MLQTSRKEIRKALITREENRDVPRTNNSEGNTNSDYAGKCPASLTQETHLKTLHHSPFLCLSSWPNLHKHENTYSCRRVGDLQPTILLPLLRPSFRNTSLQGQPHARTATVFTPVPDFHSSLEQEGLKEDQAATYSDEELYVPIWKCIYDTTIS